MRTTITLDDKLFAEAAAIAEDENASSLLTKALELMIAAESKKRLLRLSGGTPEFSIPGRDSRSVDFGTDIAIGRVAENEDPYKK